MTPGSDVGTPPGSSCRGRKRHTRSRIPCPGRRTRWARTSICSRVAIFRDTVTSWWLESGPPFRTRHPTKRPQSLHQKKTYRASFQRFSSLQHQSGRPSVGCEQTEMTEERRAPQLSSLSVGICALTLAANMHTATTAAEILNILAELRVFGTTLCSLAFFTLYVR